MSGSSTELFECWMIYREFKGFLEARVVSERHMFHIFWERIKQREILTRSLRGSHGTWLVCLIFFSYQKRKKILYLVSISPFFSTVWMGVSYNDSLSLSLSLPLSELFIFQQRTPRHWPQFFKCERLFTNNYFES